MYQVKAETVKNVRRVNGAWDTAIFGPGGMAKGARRKKAKNGVGSRVHAGEREKARNSRYTSREIYDAQEFALKN